MAYRSCQTSQFFSWNDFSAYSYAYSFDFLSCTPSFFFSPTACTRIHLSHWLWRRYSVRRYKVAHIRDPACIGDPASTRTFELDPRLQLETRLVFETRLLLEDLRYTITRMHELMCEGDHLLWHASCLCNFHHTDPTSSIWILGLGYLCYNTAR